MKNCLFCAEELKDQAVICRLCDRPVLREAARVHLVGKSFAIGSVAGEWRYGIWDLSTGAGPIISYLGDPAGWEDCWAEFQRRETAGASPVPHPTGGITRAKPRSMWMVGVG